MTITTMSRSIQFTTIRPLLGEASSSRLSNPSIMRLHSSARRMAEEEDSTQKQTPTSTKEENPSPISAFSLPTLTPNQTLPESFRASQTSSSSAASLSSPPVARSRPSFGRQGVRYETRSPHKLHVQATRNNCIVTLTTSDGSVIKRESSGSIGFKKSARSGYEAGYQVAMTMFQHIQTNKVNWRLANINIIWKGLGQGREAVYRAMLSNEGTDVRNLIRNISDNTAIKVGGTRPKKRRML